MTKMQIDAIYINNVLPVAMEDRDTSASQVWRRSVAFRRGECYLIEAASGGGKSSLCSFLYGLRKDYSGEIRFNSDPADRFTIDQWCRLRRENLAFLPQELRLFPELTALENVQIKNNLTSALSREEVLEMFVALGLDGKFDAPCSRLSIGEQQRVAIIRTLCQPFDFLLLDEPVSHLDPANNLRASEMILSRVRALGAGIIATSVGNPMHLPYDHTLSL